MCVLLVANPSYVLHISLNINVGVAGLCFLQQRDYIHVTSVTVHLCTRVILKLIKNYIPQTILMFALCATSHLHVLHIWPNINVAVGTLVPRELGFRQQRDYFHVTNAIAHLCKSPTL